MKATQAVVREVESTTGAGAGTGTRIQSVARASQLLLWIAQQPQGATAKEISVAQGLALPTAYHLVNTLVDQGLLAKDDRRRYVLGRSTAVLAHAYLRGRTVSKNMLDAVRDLSARTGETVYLADWGEYDIRVLAVVESNNIVRVGGVASSSYEHGHARANGKALLAYAWPEIREAYLRAHPPVKLTPSTITDPEQLDKELQRIRKRGYALDEEEFAIGVSCLAAPLLRDGQIIASLAMSVPTNRFKQRRRELLAILLDVIAGLEEDEVSSEADET